MLVFKDFLLDSFRLLIVNHVKPISFSSGLMQILKKITLRNLEWYKYIKNYIILFRSEVSALAFES